MHKSRIYRKSISYWKNKKKLHSRNFSKFKQCFSYSGIIFFCRNISLVL